MCPIEYSTPLDENDRLKPARQSRVRNAILVGVSALALLILAVSILLPTMGRSRPAANVIKCSSNLKQIGLAIFDYARNNNDQLPPSLPALMIACDLTPDAFICASNDCGDDRPRLPSSATTQQVAAGIIEGTSTCSYFLCRFPSQRLSQLSPKHVLAYEKPLNHTTETNGMNVLFADGHVDWIAAPLRDRVAAELQSGQNPPPSLK